MRQQEGLGARIGGPSLFPQARDVGLAGGLLLGPRGRYWFAFDIW
jgi:hypothetical protein